MEVLNIFFLYFFSLFLRALYIGTLTTTNAAVYGILLNLNDETSIKTVYFSRLKLMKIPYLKGL